MAEYIEREKVIRQCEAIRDLAQKSLDEWKAHTQAYRDTHMAQYLSANQRMQDVNDEVMRIMAIPAADVQPAVKAHWVDANGKPIPFDDCGCPRYSAWCSKCGDWLTSSDEYSVRGRYCPNCGADMREPPKED